MTKSKIERIRTQLIEEYGDRTILSIVERHSKKEVYRYRLSNINITCTADITEIKRIIAEGVARTIPIDIPRQQKDFKS